MADEGRLAQLLTEVPFVPAAQGRLAQVLVEVPFTPAANARLAQLFVEIPQYFIPPEAAPLPAFPDPIAVGTPIVLDGSASVGGLYKWSYASAPSGSATVRNVDPTPMADNNGTSFISMASNKALYHANGNATDSSGNGNNATLSNITYASGKVSAQAWQYDTAGAEATIGTAISTAGDWSVSLWAFGLKANGTSRWAMLNTARNESQIVVSDTNLLGVVKAGVFYSSTISIDAADYTDWNHVVAVSRGNDVVFYINGEVRGTVLGQKPTSDIKYIGGNSPSSGRFADKVGEVAIFQRSLTAQEVQAIHQNQSGTGAYDGDTGYAAVGPQLSFTPDKAGTIVVDLTAGSPDLAEESTSTTSLQIVGGGAVEVLQGELLQSDLLQGDLLQGDLSQGDWSFNSED